jgi:hypothetical protein
MVRELHADREPARDENPNLVFLDGVQMPAHDADAFLARLRTYLAAHGGQSDLSEFAAMEGLAHVEPERRLDGRFNVIARRKPPAPLPARPLTRQGRRSSGVLVAMALIPVLLGGVTLYVFAFAGTSTHVQPVPTATIPTNGSQVVQAPLATDSDAGRSADGGRR